MKMITKEKIIEAYLFLRRENSTISDDVLRFIKDAAIKEFELTEKFPSKTGNFLKVKVGDKVKNNRTDSVLGFWEVFKSPVTIAEIIILKKDHLCQFRFEEFKTNDTWFYENKFEKV